MHPTKKTPAWGLLLVFLVLSTAVGAQQATDFPPVTFYEDLNLSTAASYTLPFLDNDLENTRAENIKNARCASCKNMFYGTPFPASIDLINNGTLDVQSNGDKIWRYRVTSSTALGMQFYFSTFNLPAGGEFHIINESTTQYLGAYTDANNPTNTAQAVQFGTQIIKGNNIILQYYQPASVTGVAQILVKNVVHVFRKIGPYFSEDPNAPQDCMIDVVCPTGYTVHKEATSVALILAKDEDANLHGACTGVLLNNPMEDGTPYFLTAKHCYVDDPNVDEYEQNTWIFLFNHFSLNCQSDADQDINAGNSIYGAELLSEESSSTPTSDYMLLKLTGDKEVYENMRVCYSGWSRDRQLVYLEPKFGIHHPLGGIKKVSEAFAAQMSDFEQQSGGNVNGNYVKIDYWSKGATSPGSSGSPLYHHNRVIGQLHGGYSRCTGENTSNDADWYGSFSVAYADGGFSEWLDPYGTNPTSVDTWCPTDPPDFRGNWPEDQPLLGVICNVLLDPDGFQINRNHIPEVTEVCPNYPIQIHRHFPGGPGEYFANTNCSMARIGGEDEKKEKHLITSSDCNADNCDPGFSQCTCRWYNYYIQVREVDFNFNPIGPAYGKWFKMRKTDHELFTDGFALQNYLPNGAIIQHGKYYALKVATASQSQGWMEHTKYFHTYQMNITIDNADVDRKVWANKITIVNSTVDNGLVMANNHIRMENTRMEYGRLEISPNSCQDFTEANGVTQRLFVDTKEQSSSYDGYEEPGLGNQLAPNQIFSLYPNPVSSYLTVTSDRDINLSVINAQGKLLRTVQFSKGNHEFSVEDLPNGVYLFRDLNSGQTEKIIVE